jgi:hypothetical protein
MDALKLSPSELTFLWDECPCCFYLKTKGILARPSAPFPSIFSSIDRAMKNHYRDLPVQSLSPDLPPGKFYFSEQFIVSQPVSSPGHDLQVYFAGKFDALLEFENGDFGIVDFKTSEAKAAHIAFYARQLEAYAYCLEHPLSGKLARSPITRLGLAYYSPHTMRFDDEGELALHGHFGWQPIQRDEGGFQKFIDEVISVLESPEPPAAAEDCKYCQYRVLARGTGL